MGSDITKNYGAKARKDMPMFDPEDLILVEDKEHKLFDERTEKPILESDVLDVMENGILEPIVVRPNGKNSSGVFNVEVVAGRQRVKWAREANKRLKKSGKELILVPAVIKHGDGETMFGISISENEHRDNDGVVIKAKKLQRFLAMGRTEAQAALRFRVDAGTIKNWTDLLNCCASVLKAVENGVIGATLAAKQLSKLTEAEQEAKLAEMIANGTTKGSAAEEAVRKVKDATTAPGRVRRKMVRRPALEKWSKVLAKGEHTDTKIARAVVSYVLGNKKALEDYPRLVEALEG